MDNNIYDEDIFFKKYSEMSRSKLGLEGAGEWETLKKLLPDFTDKKVLDLGCGYGWHCEYGINNGAKEVIGVDISRKMLEIAKNNTNENIVYLHKNIEEIDFEKDYFDIVFSSLAFHYIEDFNSMCKKINSILKSNGDFIFTVEHPLFTAKGNQDWYYDEDGKILHFPVDNYFYDGKREAIFLGEKTIKYHRSLNTYVENLIENNFSIVNIKEAKPSEKMIKEIEGMADEMRRPMILIFSTRKNN